MESRYFADFTVGARWRGTATQTVSKEEIVAFAREFDPMPFHVDEAAADASVFGGLTASGLHAVALQGKLIRGQAWKDAVLAGLGWDEVRFPHPVRVGDTLSIEFECVEQRPAATKADRGIGRTRVTLCNQRGEPVLRSHHTLLVARRES